MRKEDIKDSKIEKTRTRNLSIVGFVVAGVLLTTAVYLSLNEEKIERQARVEDKENTNLSVYTSSQTGKDINEVRKELEDDAKKENSTSNEILENQKNNKELNKKETKSTSTNAEPNNKKNEASNSKNSQLNKNNINTTNQTNKNDQEKNEEKIEIGKSNENKQDFIKPIEGDTLKIFSMDSLIYSETLQEWTTHRGIDIKADKNAQVKNIADGTIKSIKTDPRYGISITIKHNKGFESVYACLLNVEENLKEGDEVKQGQVIGNVGNSGVFETTDGMHLHFEMKKDGEYVNPELYIK